MKYIKLYENSNKKSEYWRINTKSLAHILLSLKKIGLSTDDNIYKDIFYTFKNDNFNEVYKEFFYIGRGLDVYNDDYWYWSYSINNFKNQSTNMLTNNKFEFQGVVKIENWELAADKYNL